MLLSILPFHIKTEIEQKEAYNKTIKLCKDWTMTPGFSFGVIKTNM